MAEGGNVFDLIKPLLSQNHKITKSTIFQSSQTFFGNLHLAVLVAVTTCSNTWFYFMAFDMFPCGRSCIPPNRENWSDKSRTSLCTSVRSAQSNTCNPKRWYLVVVPLGLLPACSSCLSSCFACRDCASHDRKLSSWPSVCALCASLPTPRR
jgi:hypothetical protein